MRFVFILLLVVASPFAQADEQSDTLEQYVRTTLENFREKMPVGIPEMKMPPLDPLVIPIVDEHIREGIADVKLKLVNITATGLSKFNLKSVKVDMSDLSAELGIFLPNSMVTAKYDLDGKLASIFPLYGKGDAFFQISDFDLNIKTSLDFSTGKLQMTTMRIKMDVGNIQAMFDGILGGGNLGDIINTVLSMFGKVLFDRFKPDIENVLDGVLKKVVNQQLRNVDLGALGYAQMYSPAYEQHASTNEFVDRILVNLRPELKKKDPLPLPYVRDGFEKKVGFIKFKGYAELQTGVLRGLSSLHRVNDVVLKMDNATGTFQLDARLGVNYLNVNYNCKLYFMGIKIYPKLTAVVKSVHVRAKITVNVLTNYKKLDFFRIEDIQRPAVKVTNVSVLGYLATFVGNLAINPIVNAIKGTLEGEVTRLLADVIAKVDIPF